MAIFLYDPTHLYTPSPNAFPPTLQFSEGTFRHDQHFKALFWRVFLLLSRLYFKHRWYGASKLMKTDTTAQCLSVLTDGAMLRCPHSQFADNPSDGAPRKERPIVWFSVHILCWEPALTHCAGYGKWPILGASGTTDFGQRGNIPVRGHHWSSFFWRGGRRRNP